MKRSSLIGHTVEVLDLCRSTRQPADRLLKDFYRTRRYLGAKDRRYISECFFGVLRHLSLLELTTAEAFRISGFSIPRGRVPSVALCAAFLLKLAHEDAATLPADIAGLWRMSLPDVPVGEFISGLLAAHLPEEIAAEPVKRIAIEQSFPECVVAEWIETYGVEETEQLCRALNEPAPVTIRVNTLKVSIEECGDGLASDGVASHRTTLSPVGLVLGKRVDVHILRPFREGWFEVQDEASQLIAVLLEPLPGQLIVDACAGGGGKTLHIGALMSNSGRLVAIDTDERRLREITPRVERAGISIAQLFHSVRNQDAIERIVGQADGVLIDAPCSGVGTFRRNPGAKLSLNRDTVVSLSRAQASILDQYSRLVKPGGRLVYSTCTLLRLENQEQIDRFLTSHKEFSLIDAPAVLRRQNIAIEGDSRFVTLLPHRTGTDGFFAAVMIRTR